MEPFKNKYNKKSLTWMGESIQKHYKTFDVDSFVKSSIKNFSKMEMKERVVQISDNLNHYLPGPYKKNISILVKTLRSKKNPDGLHEFILWPYSHFIETYGMNQFDVSMKALYELTQAFTSEWGIRPFLEKDSKKVYQYFEKWVDDENEHVRRWVSEGTRPNLPWGKKITNMEKLFSKNIKLLTKLKDDPSLYVRKSVANHMNDITWYDSELALKHLKKWSRSKNEDVQWIIKQALRSLLKQGNPEALELLGYSPKSKNEIHKIKLSKKKIKEGDSFDLSFDIQNKEKTTSQFMVDYTIYYPKANGKLSPKTFKLKNLTLKSQESSAIKKKIDFKKVTTRVHYKGTHELHIQVNGVVKSKTKFELA